MTAGITLHSILFVVMVIRDLDKHDISDGSSGIYKYIYSSLMIKRIILEIETHSTPVHGLHIIHT